MANTYTKLFRSIVSSTIWAEDPTTTKVWVTLLALADYNGEVEGTVPYIARLAYVSVDDCSKAIDLFLAPDPNSRTPDNAGRRIERTPMGWVILNHAKYRAMATKEARREADRLRKARERAAKRNSA